MKNPTDAVGPHSNPCLRPVTQAGFYLCAPVPNDPIFASKPLPCGLSYKTLLIALTGMFIQLSRDIDIATIHERFLRAPGSL
jgi:hypothetical protein